MTSTAAEQKPEAHPHFSFGQRLALWIISAAGWLAIALIGRTLRFEASCEDEPLPTDPVICPAIYVFWHRCVFPACFRFRNQRIAVMTSRSYDGEYIARIIEGFGFEAVRGSSSRGAVGALLGMHSVLAGGRAVAFTIDGPRGPRYVAKPGAVLLARKAQTPLIAFYLACERAWVLNSWDAMMIPKPFSRVHVRFSRVLRVPSGGDQEQWHAEMQSALERVRDDAEAVFGKE